MFAHDFYFPDKRKTEDEIMGFLKKTKKQIVYTVGYKWKSPATYEVPITKEHAISLISNGGLFKITEKDNVVDVNMFTTSDMW